MTTDGHQREALTSWPDEADLRDRLWRDLVQVRGIGDALAVRCVDAVMPAVLQFAAARVNTALEITERMRN